MCVRASERTYQIFINNIGNIKLVTETLTYLIQLRAL